MSEFIGSRISLISKSDIRYAGTLHNIDSENSSVALENVQCHGTEGRRGNPDDEIAPSSNIYEYIVFRGSDVKDLRIDEPPKETRPSPSSELNDPAILGAGSRPQTSNDQLHQQNQRLLGNQLPPSQYPFAPPRPQQQSPFQPALDGLYLPYNQFQHQQRFGGYPHGPHGPHPGFPGGPPNEFPNYPGGSYGPPPNWRPSPGPPNQHAGMQPMLQHSPALNSAPGNHQARSTPPGLPAELGQKPITTDPVGPPAAPSGTKAGPDHVDAVPPPPPLATKPDMSAETAGGPVAPSTHQGRSATRNGVKGRILPAVPLIAPRNRAVPKPANNTDTGNADGSGAKQGQAATDAAKQYQQTTQAASAAVAAAMAKLPPAPYQRAKPNQTNNDPVDNLTKKVNEMRTNENNRVRGRGTGSTAPGSRGRGGRRGQGQQGRALEVPKTDFDFESANAKFNKQELANEADGEGGPALDEVGEANGSPDVVIPAAAPTTYNKASFFDNISSEAKERDDTTGGKGQRGGLEFRNEERKRNMETFGQGSVDSNFRGRGRGRGSGFGRGYGRGQGQYHRGGSRGGRGGMRNDSAQGDTTFT